MALPQADLAALSKASGVDLEGLRTKYLALRAQCAPSGREERQASAPPPATEAMDRLARYQVCMQCQGLGIQRVKYNHMMLERTCDACDGESVVWKEVVDNVKKSMETDRQVEES